MNILRNAVSTLEAHNHQLNTLNSCLRGMLDEIYGHLPPEESSVQAAPCSLEDQLSQQFSTTTTHLQELEDMITKLRGETDA